MKRRHYVWLVPSTLPVLAQPAAARTSTEDLRDLIERQAALIADLQARVAALEQEHAAPADVAPPLSPSPTPVMPTPAIAQTVPATRDTAIDWSAGAPTFRSADGSSFHVRGRVHVDASTTSGSRFDTRDIAGTELSSARIGVDGTYRDWLGYKIELEFDGNAVSLKEAYLSYEGRLFGQQLQIFAGNKTGDRTIDGSSYDDFVPFFQRSMLATSIGPEKGIMGVGLLAKLASKDWHIGLDVAGNNPGSNAGTVSDTVAFVGRGTWTPQIADESRFHFGGWGFYETIPRGSSMPITQSVSPGEQFNDTIRISMIPLANPRSSTGEGGEIGFIRGPFWMFGEYGTRHIMADSEVRVSTSYVAEAGFFLTGEHTNFSPSFGSWTPLVPRRSVFDGGLGAIELLARFERSQLGRPTVAGSGEDLTVGLNWNLSANVRFLANWVRWNVRNPVAPYIGSDTGDTFNLRFDTTF